MMIWILFVWFACGVFALGFGAGYDRARGQRWRFSDWRTWVGGVATVGLGPWSIVGVLFYLRHLED